MGLISFLNRDKMCRFSQAVNNYHMESWPFSVVGSPTIKSILMSSHFQLGIDSGWSSPADFKWIALIRQQLSHQATNAVISFFIFVHQKHVFRSWYILLLPGWMDKLEECASSRIWFLNSLSFGTTSRSLNHSTPLTSSRKCFLPLSSCFWYGIYPHRSFGAQWS